MGISSLFIVKSTMLLGNLNEYTSFLPQSIFSDKISDLFNRIDILIKKEKKANIMLKRRLGIIEQKANSSDEMIDDYSEMYDIGYLRNWGLFISIFLAGLCISKVFKQQNMNTN